MTLASAPKEEIVQKRGGSTLIFQAMGLLAMAGMVLLRSGSPSVAPDVPAATTSNVRRALSNTDKGEYDLSADVQDILHRIRNLEEDMDYVKSLLPNYTLAAMEEDPYSPQSMAFDFVMQDLNLDEYSDERLQQRFALATFYYAAGGTNWTNYEDWLQPDTHECQWGLLAGLSFFELTQFGLADYVTTTPNYTTSCDEDDMYQAFLVDTLNAEGTLPAEFFELLPSLKGIYIHDTNLTGTIPSTIGTLSNLTQLHLPTNRFTGMIPTEIGNLTMLDKVRLQENMLSGQIPSELGQLQELQHLDLADNDLIGPIPPEIGIPSLWFLILMDNPNLDGPIPEEWVLDANMDLRNTALSGTIPDGICPGWWRLRFDCSETLCGCGCDCEEVAVVKGLHDGWRE